LPRHRTRRVALLALYGALSVAFCWPLFDDPQALGANDWDQHLFYYAAVLKNVVEYGQMPFWNPWYCGGNVMWQNPQIAILSPVYPLTAVMSLQLAMKVNIVLHYWLGFVGMHLLLTRVLGITFLPTVIYLATLVTASGAPAIHLRVGHSVFLPGFYLPFQLYFFFRAFKTGEWKYVFLSAATLALMILNGGTHILPMSIAALGCFSLVAAIARRDWRPIALAIAFGVAGLAYSAPKLLPVVQYVTGPQFWDTRNPTEHPDRVTVDMLAQTYLVPTQKVEARLPMQRHGWHEYGNYIGPVSAILIDLGILFVLLRRTPAHHWFGVSLAVTSLFLFLLSLGEFSQVAPASLAHYVPLFSSFRIPSRYTIPLLQFAALTLGWAFQSIVVRHGFPSAARIAVSVVALAASAHLIVTNQWNLKNVFIEPPFDTAFHWNSGPRQITTDTESSPYTKGSPMLSALMQDRSFYNCYESLQVPRGAGPGSPVLDANPSARVSDVDFTPNRLTFTVKDGAEPARVVLNQNWADGWTTDAGVIAVGKPTELSTVTIPPGTTGRFTFTFVPPGFYAGVVILIIALIATTVLWRRRMRAVFSA
jgi:multisubunit Na+/H+ antiporter MnhC subunit